MLLPWGGTTVLGHLIRQWNEVGAAQVAVVCGKGDGVVAGELDRLGVSERIINAEPAREMFSSIQCAAGWPGWLPEIDRVVIALGDQPHLANETLRRLMRFSEENPESICQPGREGRARHPIVLPRAMLELLALARCETMKEFLAMRAGARKIAEVDDPGLDLDLDTPGDYERVFSKQ
jgi:CTP:molybdopterin cytidylyltransferase MocA